MNMIIEIQCGFVNLVGCNKMISKLVESNKVIVIDAYKSRWFSTISGNTRKKFVAANSRCLFWLFQFSVADSRCLFGFFNVQLRTQDIDFAFFCCMHFINEHYRIHVHCVGTRFWICRHHGHLERKEMRILHLSYSGSNVSLQCDCNFSIAMNLVYNIDILSYNNQICAMFICAPHV
ncbi:hypothetical protein AMTRI_Chr08g164640 [Amborella trichopoda]